MTPNEAITVQSYPNCSAVWCSTARRPRQFASLADSDIEYGTVQIPINEAGQTQTAPLGGELWTVPRTGDEARQAKAAEFVQCLTAADKQLDYAKGGGIVPSRTALAEQ